MQWLNAIFCNFLHNLQCISKSFFSNLVLEKCENKYDLKNEMIIVYFLVLNRNYYQLHPKRKHGGGASLFRHLVFYPLLRLIAHSKKPSERKIRVTV